MEARIMDHIDDLRFILYKVESSVAVIRSGATFMQQLEKDAPIGLEPGDYCDASKDVVDELQPGDRATVNRDQWRELVELAKPKLTYLSGNSYLEESTIGYHEGLLKMDTPREGSLHFTEFRRRLLGTIARRKEAERAEKVAALKFGVRVRTAYGEGIYQMEDEHGAHVVVHPDTTQYMGIDHITILP
jgi:hypothetical protein